MPRRSLPITPSIAGRMGLLLLVAAWPLRASARPAIPPIQTDEGKPAGAASLPGASLAWVQTPSADQARRANFLSETSSPEARRVADWAVSSGDHGRLPFVVVDKIGAKLFVFDAAGVLRGASMALLGFAHGDDSAPDIGTRKLALIRPEERITPAGRFVATLGHDLHVDVLWVDYDAAISLHRVVTGNPGDHRRQRLASASTLDKRISYGCINVPAEFYDTVVRQTFAGTSGIVYILPESRKLEDVFPLAARGGAQ